MKTKLFFLSTLFLSASVIAQIDFEAHVTVDDTGGTNNPQSVFAADLDGDGDMDIISASQFDDKIAWYKNIDGQGNFGPQQIISETTWGATSVFATDMDNDGDVDILAALYDDYTIGWFENINGQGDFGTIQIISGLTEGATLIYAADADNDGDIDVFSASALDLKIAWYQNIAPGLFGEQQIISSEFYYPIGITSGDIDGDGDLDLLSGSSYIDSRVAWFQNEDGFGDFVEQQALNTDIEYCRSAILLDVDGDGDLDIVATSWKTEAHRIIWFENTNGNGYFNNSPQILSLLGTNARPETLFATDFDNDGKVDIALGSENAGISWFKNNGSGNFGNQQFIDNNIQNVQAIFTTDIDADGDQDLLSAAGNADRVAFQKNITGQGDFGTPNVLVDINGANGVIKVLTADLDSDGDKDILSALTNDNRITWQENLDGQGTFSQLQTIATVAIPRSIATGDIDGDGDIDVFAASGNGKVIWLENLDGQANFGSEQLINNEDYASVVYTVDIDNDGDLDVFTSATTNSSKIFWQENLDGSGTFGPTNIILEGNFVNETLFAEDIDNDGYKDLIAGYYGATDTVAWFKNLDGQGTFGAPQHITNNILVPDSVYAADLDNDGDRDVLATSYGTDKVIWYENTDGQGTFGNEHIITSTADGASNVFAKDLDNDGDIDVLCAAWTGNEAMYYLNDGAGSFSHRHFLILNFKSASCIVADDLNGDNKMDVIASAYAADQIIWFENRGPLSIEENTTNHFNLYPNPTNGLLNINSTTTISEITLYNNLGQLLFTFENKGQIDISSLSNGIYFIKIIDENGQTETKKVVKI